MFNNRVEWKIELLKYQLQSEKEGYFDLKIECLDGYFLAHRIVFAASTTLEWSAKKSILRETLVVEHTLEEVSKILFLAYTGELFLKDTLSYLDNLVKLFQFNEDKLCWGMPYNVAIESKSSYNLSQRKVRACRQCVPTVPSDDIEAAMKEVFIYENGHVEFLHENRESSSFMASEYFVDVGYSCKYCSCIFMESIQLEGHKGTCLPPVKVEVPSPPVKQEVPSPPLAFQVQEEFTGTSDVTPICKKAFLAPRRVVSTGEVVCRSCGYENNSVMKLVQHYDEVHDIKPSRDYCMKPVKCKKCPFFRKRLPMSTFLNHVFNCKVAAVNNSKEILDCLLQNRSPFTSSLVLQNSPYTKDGYKTPKRNNRKRKKLGGGVIDNKVASARQNSSRKSQKQLKIEIETVNIELVSNSELLENPQQPFREHYSTEPPETNHIRTTPMNKSRVQLRKNALPVKKIDFLQLNAPATSKWEKDVKIESCSTSVDTNQFKNENKIKENSALSDKTALMENCKLIDTVAIMENATLSDNAALMENATLLDNVTVMENATITDNIAKIDETATLSDNVPLMKNDALTSNVTKSTENAIFSDKAAITENTKLSKNAKDLSRVPIPTLLSTHDIDENENNDALAHLASQSILNEPETSLGEKSKNAIKKQARIPSFLKKSLMHKKRRIHENENPNISIATDATKNEFQHSKNEATISDKIETKFTKTICENMNRNCYVISRNHASPGTVLNTSSLFNNLFPIRINNNYKIPKKLVTSGTATQPSDMPMTSKVSNLQRTPKRKLSSSPEGEKGVTTSIFKPRPWKKPKIERLALGRARFRQLTSPNNIVSLHGHKKPSHVWSCNYCRKQFNNQILYMRHSCQLSCPK